MPNAQRGGSQDGLVSDLYQIESGELDDVRVSRPVATPSVTGMPTARNGFLGMSTSRGGREAMIDGCDEDLKTVLVANATVVYVTDLVDTGDNRTEMRTHHARN